MGQLQSLLNFRNALQGGGARPNLFQVELTTLPSFVDAGDWDSGLFQFTCKAAALPASNIAAIEVPVRGKTLKIPGDRTFDPWTVTIINTQDFKLRKAFEKWMEGIANQNEGRSENTTPSSYQQKAVVKQLARDSAANKDEYVKAYTFEGIYPSNISAIDVSYDDTDTIEEFTVEFQVQYWYPGIST